MSCLGIWFLPLDKTESLIYLRNLKSLSLLQLVPVRLFGTGQAAHIHEEKNREGVILLKLYYWKLGRAISRPFVIAIRAARLYTAWLRYRFYVV